MRAVVGVVGGGQLARMMIPPAVALGLGLRVLADADGSPAELAVTAVGSPDDASAVLDFVRDVSVVTFDHEHVPQSVLRALEDVGATVRPSSAALLYAQDKLRMRSRLSQLALPVPAWAAVSDAEGVTRFLSEHGGVAVVKTSRGGYDGKGVRVVRSAVDVEEWMAAGDELLIEEMVPFRRELAQLVARSASGEIRVWPVVETLQRDGVCVEVIAPAPDGHEVGAEASRIAIRIAEQLDVVGVLAVELFQLDGGALVINELAMRPHNSGHWTIDGAVTSQFEQHLRAVLDLPLGDPTPRAQWSVMVNILGGPSAGMAASYAEALAAHPDVKVHSYAKAFRAGRKVGHVTASGEDLFEVRARARAAAAFFEA